MFCKKRTRLWDKRAKLGWHSLTWEIYRMNPLVATLLEALIATCLDRNDNRKAGPKYNCTFFSFGLSCGKTEIDWGNFDVVLIIKLSVTEVVIPFGLILSFGVFLVWQLSNPEGPSAFFDNVPFMLNTNGSKSEKPKCHSAEGSDLWDTVLSTGQLI